MLVLYDRHENGVYRLEKDLIKYNQYCQIVPVVGDVTDPARVDAMMATYRPDYIFHAAAHKHVPLMEANICEAVKNNVTGTRTIAETAQRYRASRFILVSTDKAVKPTSVMGATKRVAEFLVLSMGARWSKCHFTAGRFGNVLGSNGSVVPRFIEQIRSGGPVTVTHPEMSRFFMSIREAVQLLLFSATLDDLDALYILEMGEPVKIVDMARHLIRLLGLEPDKDIQIEFTGSRPGEKLHEELLEAEENAERSTVRNILKVVGPLPEPAQLARSIVCLETLSALGDADMVTRALSDLVPSFRPPVELPAPGAK